MQHMLLAMIKYRKNHKAMLFQTAFTHGTSEQRERWFNKGFINGTLEGGDTFKAKNL
jgi:uncharacterized protein